jgi:hypothetical protein
MAPDERIELPQADLEAAVIPLDQSGKNKKSCRWETNPHFTILSYDKTEVGSPCREFNPTPAQRISSFGVFRTTRTTAMQLRTT